VELVGRDTESRMGRGSGRRLQPTVLQAVIDRIEAGQNNTQIQNETGVWRKTTARIRLSLEYWNQPYPPPCVRRGGLRALRAAHKERLLEFVAGRPDAYLDEMAEFLYDEFDVKVSLVTVWRALAEARWSRKMASKAARERNETLRRVFQARIQAYRSDQVICLDESACNERTGDRKYGWSPVNNPVQLEYSAKRSERWSLLPALTEDGYLAHTIFQGAITAERLYEFVEQQVLPHMNPYPLPRSVLVLDNASIHHSAEFKELCREAGVRLEYLPPYSPDFNPIEQTFKALKSWIKKNNQQAALFEDFAYFLEYAVQKVCYRDATGLYRYCGWVVE
jgi:transposase